MKTRIAIPVENQDGLNAPIAEHFGRAPFFAIVDLDEKGKVASVKTEANTGEHHGGTGHPHENLLALNPNVIVAYGMGPGGLASFQNAEVNVLKATAKTVEESVAQFKAGKLEKLTGGCEHAHHHHH
jgi:predicted Fe-Mo cluster-binding NifX family protein